MAAHRAEVKGSGAGVLAALHKGAAGDLRCLCKAGTLQQVPSLSLDAMSSSKGHSRSCPCSLMHSVGAADHLREANSKPHAADLFEVAAAWLKDVMEDHHAISERLRRFLALSATLHEIRTRRALATQRLKEEQAGLSCSDLQVRNSCSTGFKPSALAIWLL